MEEEDKGDSNSNPDRCPLPLSRTMPTAFGLADLKKPTMKETYRNVCTAMGQKEIYEKLQELIFSKSPLPLFEEGLMLMVIDGLQLEKEVVKILLSQNDRQIKRILGCKWFFKALPFEFCTSELFPHVSLSLRCKIITRLSKHLESSAEAEKYFAFVRKNYDNQRADYLLPKCSSEFILTHFNQHKSILSHPAEIRILLAICKRYPEVGLQILQHIFSIHNNSYRVQMYRRILLYLAGNHHDLFMPFLKKHHLQLAPNTFGRKVTKKLGKKIGGDLLSGEIRTLPFNFKVLFSILPFEERVRFLTRVICRCNGSGPSPDSFSRRICEYLKLLKPEFRLEYIEATFKQLFSLDFNCHSKYWSLPLMELLPVKARMPFVLNMEHFFDEEELVFNDNMAEDYSIRSPEEFIPLYDFGIAFGKLKEIMRTTPLPSVRINIMSQMVKNCKINSDLTGLQEVVDYVVTRHRNDDCKILYSFIQLVLSEFPRSALTPRTFEKLDELFQLCALRNEPPCYVLVQWKERHIYHLIENRANIDTLLEKYFESFLLRRAYGTFLVDYKGRHSKTLLVKLCDMAVRRIRSTESETSCEGLFRCVVGTCVSYSKANPGSRIWAEVPGLQELLLEKLKSKYKEAGGEEWPPDVWERYNDDITEADRNPDCVLYVLVRKPDLVERHLEGVMNCLLSIKEFSRHFKIYKNCFNFAMKAASFYGKTAEVKDLLLKEFRTGNSFEKRRMALILYSQISTIDEFWKAVEEYFPHHDRIEPHCEADFAKIQLLIPALIKNVRPRWKNFDLILKFFKRDFLKVVKFSLHACCHYTRVDVAIPFLKRHLATLPKEVSYQKHFIRLIAELSSRSETVEFCLELWGKHNHYTIRTILFYFVSKHFVEQPTRDGFAVLQKCVLECCTDAIDKMPRLEMVPDEFLGEYVDALMRFSEKQSVGFRNDFQSSLLSHFYGKRIGIMPEEFSERIIKNHLFNPVSGLDVKEFTCHYLMEGPNSVSSRVRTIFDIVSKKKPPPMMILRFLEMARQMAMPNLTAHGDLFVAILDNWPEYPPGVLYEERVLYTYCSLYQKASRGAPEPAAADLATELRELYSGVENLRDVVVIFGLALRKFLGSFGTAKAVAVVRELVSGSKDRNVAISGIWALPKEAICWFREKYERLNETKTKQKKAVEEVFRILEGYEDEIVEIFLRRRFFGGE